MRSEGRVLAYDVDDARLRQLESGVIRAGLQGLVQALHGPAALEELMQSAVSRILADKSLFWTCFDHCPFPNPDSNLDLVRGATVPVMWSWWMLLALQPGSFDAARPYAGNCRRTR